MRFATHVIPRPRAPFVAGDSSIGPPDQYFTRTAHSSRFPRAAARTSLTYLSVRSTEISFPRPAARVDGAAARKREDCTLFAAGRLTICRATSGCKAGGDISENSHLASRERSGQHRHTVTDPFDALNSKETRDMRHSKDTMNLDDVQIFKPHEKR